MIFLFKWGLSGWGKIVKLDSSSKKEIFETKFDTFDNFFSWFSI